MSPLIMGLIAAVLLIATTALNMLWTTIRLRRVEGHADRAIVSDPTAPMAGLIGQVQLLGERLRRFYAPSSLEHLRGAIQAAGYNPHRVLPLLLAGRLIMMVSLIGIACIICVFVHSISARLLIIAIGVVLGMLGPEWILGLIKRRFATEIERGTPDAIDLLVVCSEAGMGLESALERISAEMLPTNPAIASVLLSLLDDLRILPNRRIAFANLGTRSGSEGLRRLGTMLSQSMQYGTSLGHSLRTVAEDLRRDRMHKLEERAVKLPAKLIFPMVGLIMPSLFITILGPTMIRLLDMIANLGHH